MKIKKSEIRQKKILKFLQNKKLSLGEIMQCFSKENFETSQITIIRDLKKLEVGKQITKTGKSKSAIYSINLSYSLLETVDIDAYFKNPAHKRNAKKTFNFEIFKDLETDIFFSEEKKLLKNLHQKFQQKISNFDSEILKQKEFERIIIEFAWKSSSIEGNTYSLLETERLIKEHKTTDGKTAEEAKMILNHKEVFDFVLNNPDYFQTISRKRIEELHKILTKEINITSNIRKIPVGIVGTDYKPLDNCFQIEEMLEKTVKLVNIKTNFFEKSFLLLVLLSYIQAFEDGNKRTARMTANSILVAYNSCPLSYKTVEEIDYKKATLLFYEQNNLSFLKKIFIDQYKEAVENYF
jgi:Fic family protein